MNVGPGILEKMAAAGDAAFRDSDFGKNSDGSEWETGHGYLGDYRASNAQGDWRTEGPLPAA